MFLGLKEEDKRKLECEVISYRARLMLTRALRSVVRCDDCMSPDEMGILRSEIRGEFRPQEAWG
jgi:hypothetical protein